MRVLPISSVNDIPSGCSVVTGGISGGTYEEYLQAMISKHKDSLCILLEPIFRLFQLPDYTGQGQKISEDEMQEFKSNYRSRFSQALCTNYIFIPDPVSVILFDDDTTLFQKAELMRKHSIPLLAADPSLVKKLRLPD